MKLPKGIEVSQWFPEEPVALSYRRNYDHGEQINMTGMKMKFVPLVRSGGKYIRETGDVDYRDFKGGHWGTCHNSDGCNMCYKIKDFRSFKQIYFVHCLDN